MIDGIEDLEPAVLKTLDAHGPTGWVNLWAAMERPSAFHVRLAGHQGAVLTVAFGEVAGRTILASGGLDRVVRLWDPCDQSLLANLEGHAGEVDVVACGVVDGRAMLASGGYDHTVRLWDLATNGLEHCLTIPGGHPVGLVFATVGERDLLAVASAADDDDSDEESEGRVELWDATTGERVRTLHQHWEPVLGVAVVPIGDRTALAAVDAETVYLWDLATGDLLTTWTVEATWPRQDALGSFVAPLVVAVLDDRVVLGAVGVTDRGEVDQWHDYHTVVFWDVQTFAEVRRRELNRDETLLAVTTVAGASLTATATYDRTLHAVAPVANARVSQITGTPVADLYAHTDRIVAGSFATVGTSTYLATAGVDGTLLVWDAATPHRHIRDGRQGSGLALGAVREQPVLVVGTRRSQLHLLNAATGELVGTLDCDTRRPYGHDCLTVPYRDHCCRAVAAGTVAGRPLVASSGDAGQVVLWDPASRADALTLEAAGSPDAMAFGAVDNRGLLVAGTVVFDAVTGDRIAVLRDQSAVAPDSVTANTFGVVDGRPVVATRTRRDLHLWEPLTGRHVRTFAMASQGAGLAMGQVAGCDVLAAGCGRQVHLWDAATGDVRCHLPHTTPVTCLALAHSDGRTVLVTGAVDGAVLLWDAATGRRLTTLASFAHPVHAVTAATIDGRLHVFGQARSGRVLAWRVDLPLLTTTAEVG